MKRQGRPRRALIARLAPEGDVVVDVGADHGHVAAALGAIATERHPHIARRRDLRWVIADGLMPFRRVDVAIIAGMGALSIARILEQGPRPRVGCVLHAQDDPPALRQWLAEHGWRIDAEGLAPEAGRFAEVMRVTPGREESTGLALSFGPRLLEHGDPWLLDHLEQLRGHWGRIAHATRGRAPEKHVQAVERVAFLEAELAARKRTL